MQNLNLDPLWVQWLIPVVAALAVALLGGVLRKILLKRFAKSTDFLGESLRFPATVLVGFLAMSVFLQSIPSAYRGQPLIVNLQKVAAIVLTSWILGRLSSATIRSGRIEVLRQSANQTVALLLTRTLLVAITLLIVLDTLGISITPILASLGVGSLAVALALQDTLGNFFAGVYLYVDRPIRVGDFIRVEAGLEGIVTRIGWRSTHVRLPANSMVIIPNTKLASATLVNYDFPSPEVGVTVSFGVSYDANLEHVEKVIIDLSHNQATVRFDQFAESSITVNVGLKASSITEQANVKHDFIKALHTRFKQEKIEIPYPQRVVHQNP